MNFELIFMSLFNKFKKKPKKQAVPEVMEKPKERVQAVKPQKAVGEINEQVYRILKSPKITEKATGLSKEGKYIFDVYEKTNKIEIKRAVEGLYKVKVKKVNVLRTGAKPKRLGMSEGYKKGQKTGFKKAIITLEKGDKIEL